VNSPNRICLLAIAALGLLASLAPSASADTVCSVKESPCSEANALAKGTVMKSSLKTGTTFTLTGVADQVVCNASAASYEITSNVPGKSGGTAIAFTTKSETFGECTSFFLGACSSFTATKLTGASKWVANSLSPGNGSVFLPPSGAILLEYTCKTSTCRFEVTASEKTHTMIGGATASETWQEPVKFVSGSGFCPSGATLKGERTFTSPSGAIYWMAG
jgi:hypothetical protein